MNRYNYITNTKHDGYYAYAITNNRIVMGQKSPVAEDKLQTLELAKIAGVTYKAGMAFGWMTIVTTDGDLKIGLEKQSGDKTYKKVTETIKFVWHTVLRTKINIVLEGENLFCHRLNRFSFIRKTNYS